MTDVRLYKTGQGKTVDEQSVRSAISTQVGEIDTKLEVQLETLSDGVQPVTLHVVSDADPVGITKFAAGVIEFPNKKNQLAVAFEETPIPEISDVSRAQEALDAKNQFLEETTGRNSEKRRKSMKKSDTLEIIEDAVSL